MLISERIFRYLVEKDLSQVEFSLRTGISQSTISDWKRKGTNPSADKIMIICSVLDISPYELLTGTENTKHKEYIQPDSVVVDRQSKEYHLLRTYRNLAPEAQMRVEGYVQALSDTK